MADASLRYVKVYVSGEALSSRTEYILGRKSRSESRVSHSLRNQQGTLRAWIENQLAMAVRQFTAQTVGNLLLLQVGDAVAVVVGR